VNPKLESDMHQLLWKKAEKIIDPVGREVQVLSDRDALSIANQCRSKVHNVYIEALKLGIFPYRYLRNRETISLREQLKLAESRVAVVGAGGLGGQAILLLARLGIGHLVVVDHDVFDETNLNRQALCSEKALGNYKSEEAVAVVASINQGVEVAPYRMELDSSNALDVLSGSDVVIDALDNVPDRFVLERITKKLGIPLVHGALDGFEGRLMTIFPDDPGFKHLYGVEDMGGDKSKSLGDVLGAPAPMPSLIATLQVMEVLKIILKRGRIFRNIMVHVDLETGQLNEFAFEEH